MISISQAIGAMLQPVLIAIVTVAVLALLRLITPTVRWGRRLKQDGAIYAALPDGKEKEMWAVGVTAQAERLRIYREDLSMASQAIGWYALISLAIAPVALIWDGAHGWESATLMTGGNPWLAIPGVVLIVLNLGFAVFISARLILGRSTLSTAGTGGHYPRYDALRRAERRRKAKRSAIERRLAMLDRESAESIR